MPHCQRCDATLGDRTLLDALAPAPDVMCAGGSATAAAETGAQSTAAMVTAGAGRSAHVPAEHLLVSPIGARGRHMLALRQASQFTFSALSSSRLTPSARHSPYFCRNEWTDTPTQVM